MPPRPHPAGRNQASPWLRHGLGRLALILAAATLLAWTADVASGVHLDAPAPTAILLDHDGGFVTQVGHETQRADGRRQVEYGYWRTVPPPRVVAATLAIEDHRFRYHPGVDPLAVLRAGWDHLLGRSASGASTLAMQVARMQRPRPRTLWNKSVEAAVAIALTARYGRDAVLSQYLRLAPYGENSHGIGHAARWYFDRSAADLDWSQAALLAAIPQSPTALRLRHPGPRLRRRAARVLSLLAQAGLLDHDEASRAEAGLADPGLLPRRRRPDWLPTVLRLRTLAASMPGNPEPILHASLDPALQARVGAAAAAALAGWQSQGAGQAAVMVVRRRTRTVLASVSASLPGQPSGIDFTATPRSPGSTLKPFLFAEALDLRLIVPQDVLADLPGLVPGIDNADHAFLGPLLPRQALANSRNVPAAALLRRIGPGRGFRYLRRLGLHHLDGDGAQFGLGMSIGSLPTRLDRLMDAYDTLAEDGVARDLRWIDEAEPAPPQRLVSADSARLVARFLSDPLARLPTFPRYGSGEFPFAVALKTGTSQGYRDAWTLAWSAGYVVGVWVGRADGGPMAGLGGAAAAALAQTLLLQLQGADRVDFTAGDLARPDGTASELCTTNGATAPCPSRLTEFSRTGQPARAVATAADDADQLRIVQPAPDLHVWRNPEAPAGLDRLVLRAAAAPAVHQLVWLVDGAPASIGAPGTPFYWPLAPGRHRFQVRLPLQDERSAPLSVMVD